MSAPEDPPPKDGLEAIAQRLAALGEHDEVSVAQVLERFGPASFVPILVVPAFIVVTPLSGIPLLSTVMGLAIGLISLQMAARRRHLWLPEVLKRRHISGRRLTRAIARVRPLVRWIDRASRDRLGVLVSEPLVTVARLACAACGFAMPFLELVPFSSSILATAVLFFSVGFLARDGLFVLVGACVMGLAALIPLALIL